ncbi:unnamed protein product [Sympodiomycopsis kandeliae]
MSSTPGGSGAGGESRRRAEIEAKRAKLAELRRAREERTSRIHAGRAAGTQSAAGQAGSSEADTPTSSSHRKDLDDLVATLVGPSGSGSPRAGGRKSLGPDTDDLLLQPSSAYASPRKPLGGGGGAPSSDYSDSGLGAGSTLVSRADGEVSEFHAGSEAMASRGMPDMIDVETELFEFPQKEKVYYTKEVQTTAEVSTGNDDSKQTISNGHTDVGTETAVEAAMRKKILDEQEAAREKEAAEKMALEAEELDKEIAEELRIMSPEEVQVIFGTSDFSDFVEHSSKIVERALTDSYDYMKDYTIVDGSSDDQAESRSIKQTRVFYDEQLCQGRSITGIDWSSKHPELVVASYSRSDRVGTDLPDGLVLVWNIHLLDRPEFIFQAQTDVLSIKFSPFHSNLIIGGTYSGQILIWDTQSKQLPILKTPLSATGHTHPVYNIQVIGTQNANHLITASTDGVICSWMLDMLAQPQDSLELLNPLHPKTDEIAVTTLTFPSQETTQFWVGTEEGNIYLASRFDRAGSKAGLQLNEVYKGHSGPITGLDFHKTLANSAGGNTGIVDFSDLFLSSSMDWTAKLWRVRNAHSTSSGTSAAAAVAAASSGSNASRPGLTSSSSSNAISSSSNLQPGLSSSSSTSREVVPLLSFEETSDYVMDIKWHNVNPCIFSLVDANGDVHLYNLLYDLERPLVSTHLSSKGLNKLSFDHSKQGKYMAVGGVDGKVYVLDVANVVKVKSDEDSIELQRVLRGLGTSTAAAGATGPASSLGRSR